jgi:apocytochrome f
MGYLRKWTSILAPDPATIKDVHFLKYPIYLGGNRGRGQVYPDGSKSNNTVFNATALGVVMQISPGNKSGGVKIALETSDGYKIIELIPGGPELLVKIGQFLSVGDPLTNNPNVGGFGQVENEIVLQAPQRIQRFCIFSIVVFITQILLVLKKKQFEKVQLAEINFSDNRN